MRHHSRALRHTLFAGLFLAATCVRAADDIAGITTVGAPAVTRTVAEIMELQAQTPPKSLKPRDLEGRHARHDRSGLPQPSGAADVSQWPAPPPGHSPSDDIAPLSPQTVGTNFTGATLVGVNPTFSFPPDCMGAVGPSQYVVFVNGRIVTFNKTTGVADGVINADADVFFNPVRNGSITSDPRIRYDRLTGRWFLLIINLSTPNRILIAVSDAASANAITLATVWSYFFIDIATTPPAIANNCFADYPTLGVDAAALYIGTNNFCGSPSQTFNSTDGFVVRKSSLLGGGPIVVTVFRGLVPTASSAGLYTPQGVDNLDPAATEGYFIGVDNAAFSLLQLRRVSNPGGTPTISGNIGITVPTTRFPLLVPHLGNTGGTNGQLSSLDDRLFAAHIRNGRLWTAHNIGVNNTGVASGTLTRNGSRWYELNVPVGAGTPTLVQSGTVFTSTATNLTTERHYWVPSIMVSGQGHAAIGMGACGTNERANAATVGRLAGDVLGTTQTPVVFTASATAYNPASDPGSPGIGRRWGDYTYTSIDPLDDMTMWTVQQFCDATNSYGVRVAKLIAPPPATPSALADITAGQNPVNLTLTGTSLAGSGWFDPGADLPGVPAFNHLAATVVNGSATGTPPTVVSATYVSPTSIALVLDASSATANLPGQFYTIQVTNPDGQVASAAIVRVVGGNPVATIAAGPTLVEGDAGTTTFDFTVELSANAAADVTIGYQTSDGTATTADADYVGASTSLVIPTGQNSGVLSIAVQGDTKYESDETFTVTLTSATNATLGAAIAATGTIQNDDATPVMSLSSVGQAEGNSGSTAFSFTATLSAVSGVAASATFGTTDGTATLADNDYATASGSVTFAPGVTSQPVVVQVNGDTFAEPDEAFTVTLGALTNASAGTLVGTGTIQNDDAVPLLAIADAAVAEGHSGTTALVFTVSVTPPSNQAITVHFESVDGTALAGSDYAAVTGDLTIPALAASGTISVDVHGDLCGEPDEAFTVDLSAPSGATIGDGSATGTITNDDDATAPVVTVGVPNGGEVLQVGNNANLQWTASDGVGVTGVDLLLSRDGGATFPETIASGVANTGSFNWGVSGPSTTTARLRVQAHDAGCNTGTDDSDADFQITLTTAVTSLGGAVTEFALGSIRPNPTTGRTGIEFAVPRDSRVTLSIVDLQGRSVALLAHQSFAPGRYLATWDGRSPRGPAPVGVYFVRYQAAGRSFTRRLVLSR